MSIVNTTDIYIEYRRDTIFSVYPPVTHPILMYENNGAFYRPVFNSYEKSRMRSCQTHKTASAQISAIFLVTL